MKITVQAWSPEYGGELDLDGLDQTVEEVDVTCENRPWEPVTPAAIGELGDRRVAFIDGVERIEARMFFSDNGSAPVPGLAGSIGVGVVVCDPAPPGVTARREPSPEPRKAEVWTTRIDRFIAAGDGMAAELAAGAGLEYGRLPVPGSSVQALGAAIHDQMRSREAAMALDLAEKDMLVFVDGPLAVMSPGAQLAAGIIKSHQRRYLDDEHEGVLGQLGCGERTPLFAFSEKRPRYSWYVRLCPLDSSAHAWHGLIRCEAPYALAREQVVELADASAALLPAFASAPYWDARAPQNLVPVAGLERRLRHLLGDRELVYRMIRDAAKRMSEGEQVA